MLISSLLSHPFTLRNENVGVGELELFQCFSNTKPVLYLHHIRSMFKELQSFQRMWAVRFYKCVNLSVIDTVLLRLLLFPTDPVLTCVLIQIGGRTSTGTSKPVSKF